MKKILIIIILATQVISCVNEEYFGLSSYGNIKTIVVSNQASNAVINSTEKTVKVEIPGGVDLTAITIQQLQLSSFATADKNAGDIINLNEPVPITVTAEDGSKHVWTIISFVASSTPQLKDGDFNKWYKTSKDYYEPGESATTTIWGTGNAGTQILNKLATIPEDLGNGNYAVKMITLDNGALAAAFGTPISAGSVFTGFFDSDKIDPSNPQAAINFGVPFSGRPLKMRFKYKYQPGNVNKNKDGEVLSYSDMLDIYALLEIRINGKTERLATVWFRSSEAINEFTSKELTFTYGELDQSFPSYMFPIDHGFVSADSASFILPTHITFVASSSYDGANFAGAIGSSLILDDVEMIYQ